MMVMEGRTGDTDGKNMPAVAETAAVPGERSRELEKRGLWYHVVLFIGVSMVFIAVNLLFTPTLLWVVPVTILWAFFLMWHAWQVFGDGRT